MPKLDFNPNVKPTMNTWATYVPDRSTKPKFSTHRLENHAKAALGGSIGILYEWEDGGWVERFRRDEDDLSAGRMVCKGCEAPHKYGPRPLHVPGRYQPSPEVPGGVYLHGGWKGGKGNFEYEYWCGYRKDCKQAALPRCQACKEPIAHEPFKLQPGGLLTPLLYCDADCADGSK